MTIAPSGAFIARYFTRERFALSADGLAAAIAIVLPWSTSLTVILTWLYLIAIIPMLGVAALRQTLLEPVSALPVTLFMLAALGMLWADVPIGERLDGLSVYRLILAIPVLIIHFRLSAHAHWVLAGFLASCTALVAFSWALFAFPDIPWQRPTVTTDERGIPVRDYISQSGAFTICIFALAALAADAWRARHRWYAASLLALALVFLANVLYVVTSRTALVVLPVLLVLFGLRQFGRRGMLVLLLAGTTLAVFAWASSPYLRERVTRIAEDVQDYPGHINTPVGLRLEFWQKSIGFIAEAPLLGHGTGTVADLFRRAATAATHPAAITINPHNQVFAVAIQLGLAGVAVLLAMWCVHLALFLRPGLPAWIGLIVVVQNVISSMFNSHLFDFTQGVGYSWGVGVAGALLLRDNATQAPAPSRPQPSKEA